MTKNEAVIVNQIYLIFNRPLFSGHLCSKDKKREEATLRRHSFFKQNSMMFR